ncbi:hypothetical protein BLA29_007348 [Euroglyphus maynei]|uniref:Uncharacterized protein n=1 Tax=Euroglyphus maynei TaxID=6958 RepID=A0A1Y3BPV2_EURMA|nr:hypothetical protein BLA29_007348 [Euroglyphus maynei]
MMLMLMFRLLLRMVSEMMMIVL